MQKLSLLSWLRSHPWLSIILVALIADGILLYRLLGFGSSGMHVTFLDVGQGDAVLVEAPNGNQLLYDAGPPSGALLRRLSQEIGFWDRAVDIVVLSHPDMDHVGGFPKLAERYQIGAVVTSGASSDNGVHLASEEAIAKEGGGHVVARAGMRITLGGGVAVDVLYPDRDTSTMETNSASVVLRVAYASTSMLLSGDLPKAIESELVYQYGDELNVDVLKLGHHGSRTSTGEEWLRATSPSIAIISAGKDNRYGHPHKEVLELLKKFHIPHLGTYEEGSVTLSSDGQTFLYKGSPM